MAATITAMVPPQMVRNYDPNCMGNYYLARDGKWMWDPNCQYKGSGPISGALGHTTMNHGRTFGDAEMFGLGQDGQPISPWSVLYGIASLVGAATGAYHGYKRNNGSVGWAIGWSIFGSFLPILSIPLELAEGFGQPKKK